jgi:hypothetical protein
MVACKVKIFIGSVPKRLKRLKNLTFHDSVELLPLVNGKSS